MKTFYSILSAIINPISAEKISLGLLLSNGNKSFFDFSTNRLSLIGSLIDKENKKFIKLYLKSIENVIQHIDINQDQFTILDEYGKNVIINESYIDYLSIYNQNVVTFSKPIAIDVEVNQIVFEQLFSKFIDEETIVKPQQSSTIKIIKEEFFPRVKDHFSIEKEFSFEKNPSILLPVTIDLFGKNERYVIGQFIDLEKSVYYIKNDYFDYNQMVENFRDSMKFLISSEPQKEKYPVQHIFWNEIRKQSKQTFVDISEIGIIEEYAKQHNVQPVE